MWKSNSILLNNQWVKKEIKREKRFWNIGQWKHNTPIPVGYSKSSPQRGAGSQNTCDMEKGRFNINHHIYASVQFSSMAQLCQTLCDPMDCSTSGFPVHHELLELAQYHVYRVGDAIHTSHPLSSPSPPAFDSCLKKRKKNKNKKNKKNKARSQWKEGNNEDQSKNKWNRDQKTNRKDQWN